MTILETLEDPVLFAAAFADPSWAAWKAFLAALFGLDLPPLTTCLEKACLTTCRKTLERLTCSIEA